MKGFGETEHLNLYKSSQVIQIRDMCPVTSW